ncbi:MAG: S9 family peptidase [Acidobacteriaceae bacterium]|nr:S9 family peptidase [Acidobacteriaceae bacterium]
MRRLFLLVTVTLSAFAADGQRFITETDLYSFRWAANPQISPNGSEIVYTHVAVNSKHDNYDTALWIVPAAGGPPRQLTSGPRDASPRWSPDGKLIAFVRSVETPGKPPVAQIYLLPMEGGEARPLTEMPKSAAAPVWSPDGRTIAFTSTAKVKDFEKKKDGAPEDSDVRVITKAAYRMNGAGYYEPGRPTHIWTVEVPKVLNSTQKAAQVTDGEFSEGEPVWSRDGSKVFFTSNRVAEPYYAPPDSDLYVVSAKGGDITKVASIDGPINALALSPDGSHMAFVGAINRGEGVPQRSYSQPDLFLTSVEPNSTPKNLTAKYDFDIGGGVGGDQAAPRGAGPSRPFWSKDGRFIYVVSAEEGCANLKRVDAETGKVEPLTKGNHDVMGYSSSRDGSAIAALISTSTNIGDIFSVDPQSGAVRQLTHVNAELFSKLKLTEPEMIWYNSFDGKRIQAWVQRPPDFQEGKKYPMILDIHGGPHAAYGYTFDHEFQWMAAKGYVVLYPNPRGSTSYGQDFGNVIQYHYPGDDYKDLMAGVDDLIKRGWVDGDKMGVTGGSGGGVLTNWVIGHTTRFKAAVSQRSIADWRDFWYTADFTQFTPSWFRGAPWESEEDFKERSPITYVKNITTPLMLVEGEADFRTPPAAGGEQMFRALKYLHKPVVMVRFPGESHELSRSGKPTHRVERLVHIVGWMDKWVNGEQTHTYDVQ